MVMTRRSFKFTKLTPELAYVLGVYFGDGCISVADPYPRYSKFTLETIDKEFAEYTRSCCKALLGNMPDMQEIPARKHGTHPVHRFRFGSVEFCEWVVSLTSNKTVVPELIPKRKCPETHAFCMGFLDSEGYMAESKKLRYGSHLYQAGISNTSPFIHDIVELFKIQGVQFQKVNIQKTSTGTPFFMYTFNLRSFVAAGFNFTAERKQQRLLKYVALYHLTPSETVHQTPQGEDTVQTALRDAEVVGNINPPNIVRS